MLFYLVTFLPFIVVLILEDDLEFWHKLLAVSRKKINLGFTAFVYSH